MRDTWREEDAIGEAQTGPAGDPRATVRIEGDLDFERAPEVRDALFRLIRRGHSHVLVDVSGCTYVDSSGMLALVAAAQEASQAGGSVSLRGASPELCKILQLGHFGALLGLPAEPPPRPHPRRQIDTAVGQWHVFRIVTPAVASACAGVRHAVVREASQTPLSAEEIADIELAVGEAFANAIRHGSPRGEEDVVRVRTLRGESAFVVEVSDDGKGFDRTALVIPPPEQIREGGMGIYYMESLTDWAEFESGPQGTTVRLAKLHSG